MTKIAFQGEHGCNSDEACRKEFPAFERLACKSFDAAFEAVLSREVDFGLIPVENSLAGRVGDVHHLLPKSGLQIIGERFRRIEFHLMVNPGIDPAGLRTVNSHVMALGQCRKLIRRRRLDPEVASDTAGAARTLAEHPDPTQAALAPALAAEIYGLQIIERNVEDEPSNTTRFYLMALGQNEAQVRHSVPYITSFVFRVRNIPAALFKVLSGFATNGVNMTKLESYLDDDTFASMKFFAEVTGHVSDPAVERAFDELRFFSDQFDVIGSYPADPFRLRTATSSMETAVA